MTHKTISIVSDIDIIIMNIIIIKSIMVSDHNNKCARTLDEGYSFIRIS